MSTGEGFWAFSIRIYGKADVPSACLALQNEYGLDVNLLLYCCWLGTHGAQLDSAALAQALELTGPWAEHVVRPLRHARTWMKHGSDARGQLPPDVYAELRESIKTIELQAERLEQLTLEAITAHSILRAVSKDEAARCTSANLLLYANEAGITLDAEMRVHLATILSAVTDTEHAHFAEFPGAHGKESTMSNDG
jgi:uncharacterized protein (TIGR02444 family)